MTAVLFEVGKFLIGIYIGKQGLESTFGAAASLVVLLIWVYYSSQIVLLGAEFTRAYARRHGRMPVNAHAGTIGQQMPDASSSPLPANGPLRALARQSPVVLIGLAFVVGWAMSHPAMKRLLNPPEPAQRWES